MNIFAVGADYQRRVRACQIPEHADALRIEIGDAIELLRSIAGEALQRSHVLRHGGDAAYQQALKTASDPQAVWPPVIRISSQERL